MEALLHLATDSIPNIRFNVAKSMEVLATAYGATPDGKEFTVQKVVPILEELKIDQDADVRYFATYALQRAHTTLDG
jgi:serine/threonine-protein phosphatase 2A regulatory subunit A